MKRLDIDNQTKTLITEVSTLMGVDEKLVFSVLENLLIAWGLKILKDSDNALISIPIPYIGTIGLRYKGDVVQSSTSDMTSDADYFLSISDNFKKFVYNLHDGKDEFLGSFMKEKICRDLNVAD